MSVTWWKQGTDSSTVTVSSTHQTCTYGWKCWFPILHSPLFPLEEHTFHLILKASIIMSMKQNKKSKLQIYWNSIRVCVCVFFVFSLWNLCYYYFDPISCRRFFFTCVSSFFSLLNQVFFSDFCCMTVVWLTF